MYVSIQVLMIGKRTLEVMAESISAAQCPVVHGFGAHGLSKGVVNTGQLLCLVLKSSTDSGMLQTGWAVADRIDPSVCVCSFLLTSLREHWKKKK